MIDRFLKWLLKWKNAFFPQKVDSLALLVQAMMDNQAKQTALMSDAINGVVQASAKQADVLHGYLNLFKSDKEPERWARSEAEQNKAELLQAGFPIGGTEAEQAEWILKTM